MKRKSIDNGFRMSEEEYQTLIKKAREVDEARNMRIKELKKTDPKKYKQLMFWERISCGL